MGHDGRPSGEELHTIVRKKIGGNAPSFSPPTPRSARAFSFCRRAFCFSFIAALLNLVALLNSLDDNAIARMQAEFEAIETLEAEESSPRQRAERRRQQAKIILNVLAEDAINMNWNLEEDYMNPSVISCTAFSSTFAR